MRLRTKDTCDLIGRRLRRRSARGLLTAAVLCSSAVLAAPVAAKNINGTPHGDLLRGTAASDSINGRGGNDRLYGLAGADRLSGGPGDDRLYGGPGIDRFACGPGRDTAYGDAEDTIADDCERKVIPLSPAIGPTASYYQGTTSQGKRVGFDGLGSRFAHIALRVDANCTGTVIARVFNLKVNFDGPVEVARDGSFNASFTPSGQSIAIGGSLSGTFTKEGPVTGTIEVTIVVDPQSTCTSGALSWRAEPSSDLVLPGRYTGFSRQREDLAFDSTGSFRPTVGNFSIGYVAQCTATLSWRGTVTWSAQLPVTSDRKFTATATSSDGNLTITISGTFDAAGNVDGTVQIHVKIDYNGVRYECDTGAVDWQATIG